MKNKKLQENLQNKKTEKQTTKPIENPDTTTVSKRKGRPVGYERPEKIIIIDENYQLDLSDGMNIDVEKLVTRTKDGTNKTYQDWENNGHYTTIPNALLKVVSLMDLDKIPDNKKIPLIEYIKIHKENDKKVFKFFESELSEENIVTKTSKSKKGK